ncbi:MAG: hypothetical protein ABSF82_10380 [Candidatus Bathyarchaeia archaeon]
MNKLGAVLGFIVLAIALVASPMPLVKTLQDPPRQVVIYPNLLFAVPLMLLGALLLLYGMTADTSADSVNGGFHIMTHSRSVPV